MPLYEYQCLPSGHRFEVRHGINEEPVTECPECGGTVRRVIHPVGIVFKGSGFYATDSRSKAGAGSRAPAKPETKKESGPSETSSTSDAKSDAQSGES